MAALPQDITWGDGPELAASAWALGVPHPTGYPLYMLSLHLFQWLPVGTIAFRGHLFSAICASSALWVLYAFLRSALASVYGDRFTVSSLPSAFAVAAFALTPVVWPSATQTEVYALFILLYAATLRLLLLYIQSPQKYFAPLCFVLGLQVVHHRLAGFLVLASVLIFMLRLLRPELFGKPKPQHVLFTLKRFWIGAAAFVAPLLLLLYFPIRAAAGPPINWYDPQTFARFYSLISGEMYAGVLQNGIIIWSRGASWARLFYYVSLPFLCYSVLAFWIVFGFGVVIARLRWLGLLAIGLSIAHIVFVMFYIVGDWTVFYTPALLVFTAPLAFGIAQMLCWLHALDLKRSIVALVYAVLIVFCAMPFWVRWEGDKGLLEFVKQHSNAFPVSSASLDERFQSVDDWQPLVYAEQAWRAVPNGEPVLTGLFESTADNELNPLQYQQIVEGRGENNVIVSCGFLYLDWYREQVNHHLALGLEMRGDAHSASQQAWHDDTWQTVVQPLLLRGAVYSPSYPLPPSWNGKAEIRMIEKTPIDRAAVAESYQSYIPKGFVMKIQLAGAEEQE
ncbi:MAG: DUF2723 domain-containing protein [Candidatus Hinthialibacter antarcticus]|nr:DUF2723 domain-containing protein [Candidatus Hinthialibacter antarcticus]